MRNKILNLYARLFAKPVFEKWNRFLHHAALRGLGVLNYQNDEISGETAFLKSVLDNSKKAVVLDVGANVGRYSQQILQIAPTTQLHSFEPHPKTFEKLSSNPLLKGATLVNKGVGERQSVLELYDYENSDGSSHASLHKGVIEGIHGEKSVAHKVAVIDLQSYLTDHQLNNLTLLKIDTEGNELSVLKGLGNFLKEKRVQFIHFEFNEMNIYSKSSFLDFINLLDGYNLYRLLPGGKRLPLKTYSPADLEIYAYQNIIAERIE